jgi:hypothetical protein
MPESCGLADFKGSCWIPPGSRLFNLKLGQFRQKAAAFCQVPSRSGVKAVLKGEKTDKHIH